jgi:hypothetical protein
VDKSYTKLDIPLLEKELQVSRTSAEKDAERDYMKDYPNTYYTRKTIRLKKLIQLINEDVKVKDFTQGLVSVNTDYIVSLIRNRWRVVGKSKWYWYKDIKTLVNNYILKENV